MAEKSYAFVSLGCPKNLVDSERMLGKPSQAGYALTPQADGVDVVVNTRGSSTSPGVGGPHVLLLLQGIA